MESESENLIHIVRFAKEHQLIPILYSHIEKYSDFYSFNLAYRKIIAYLKKTHDVAIDRNQRILDEFKVINDEVKKNNISIIVLKGLALMSLLYKDLTRYISDIDLLVHKESIFEITDLLAKKLGYISLYPESYEKAMLRLKIPGKLVYKNFKKNIALNLHWGIDCAYLFGTTTAFDMEDLWKRAMVIKIENSETLHLSLSDQLIHMCVHLSVGHCFSCFKWLYDIALFVTYYEREVNWSEIVKICEQYKIKKAVYYTLFYTSRLMDIRIPLYLFCKSNKNQTSMLEIKWFNEIVSKQLFASTTSHKNMEFSSKFIKYSIQFIKEGSLHSLQEKYINYLCFQKISLFETFFSHILLVDKFTDKIRLLLNYWFIKPDILILLFFSNFNKWWYYPIHLICVIPVVYVFFLLSYLTKTLWTRQEKQSDLLLLKVIQNVLRVHSKSRNIEKKKI